MAYILTALIMVLLIGFFLFRKKKKQENPTELPSDLPDFSMINEACSRDLPPEKREKNIYPKGCADNKGLNF